MKNLEYYMVPATEGFLFKKKKKIATQSTINNNDKAEKAKKEWEDFLITNKDEVTKEMNRRKADSIKLIAFLKKLYEKEYSYYYEDRIEDFLEEYLQEPDEYFLKTISHEQLILDSFDYYDWLDINNKEMTNAKYNFDLLEEWAKDVEKSCQKIYNSINDLGLKTLYLIPPNDDDFWEGDNDGTYYSMYVKLSDDFKKACNIK